MTAADAAALLAERFGPPTATAAERYPHQPTARRTPRRAARRHTTNPPKEHRK